MSTRTERRVRIETDFGDALRVQRIGAGLSEVRLATMTGARVSEVRVWETGGAVPTVPMLWTLVGVFSLDAATTREWLDRARAVPEPVDVPEIVIDIVPDDASADPPIVVDLAARRAMRAVHRPAIRRTRMPPPRTVIPPPPPPRRADDRPAVRPVPAEVFPAPDTETGVRSEADPRSIAAMRRSSRRRRLVVAVAMVALGILLWWSFIQLNQGFASVAERLGVAGQVLAG